MRTFRNRKKIYEGKKVEKVEYTAINEYKISPLITDEKYNIFFLFLVKEKNIKNLSLATYVDDSSFLPFGSSSYIMYKHYYIYENSFININHEKLKCFIMQIPSHKKIQRLIIELYIGTNLYRTDIYTKNKSDNFFLMDNINNEITLKNNAIFTYYINYFFRQEITQDNYKMSLSKALIKKISDGNIELDVVNILKFFKTCKENKLDPKNIDNIEELIYEKKYRKPLSKDLFISNDDIEVLISKNKREKPKLLKLLTKIYIYYENNFLMELLGSTNGKDCSRILLDLLIGKEIKFEDFTFQNENERNKLQMALLHITKTKDEINYVIKISEGLVNSLKYIYQNHKEINDLIEKNAGLIPFNYLNLENIKLLITLKFWKI